MLYKTIEDRILHSYFAAAFVSMMLRDGDGGMMRYTLSGTVMQSGFSGSPVFRTDGRIVGVLVQSQSFRADFDNANAPIYVLPIVSPILPLKAEIESVFSTNKENHLL